MLRTMEKAVGSEAFLAFFRAYVARFKYGTVDTAKFFAFVEEHFDGAKWAALTAAVDFDKWLLPGMPPVDPKYDEALAVDARRLGHEWAVAACPAGPLRAAYTDWSSRQRLVFLETVAEDTAEKPLPVATLRALEEACGFDATSNAEITFRWLVLRLRAGDQACVDRCVAFATTFGRMKFARPMYREMYASAIARTVGVATFKSKRSMYHPICQKMVAKDLGLDDADDANAALEAAEADVAAGEEGDHGLLMLSGIIAVSAVALFVLMKKRKQ